ncbi:MAG: MBL fold metallo-hydrolase [Desulfurococcales archaeon]|nr:MBL fold metallo-hydrolase [Desulfurococcales archaeon]
MTVELTVLGSGREVGRAALLVGGRGEKPLLLDYGVNFDEDDLPVFPGHVRPRDIEAVAITHSHLDHVGAAPSLFVSTVPKLIATPVTIEVSRLLLYDFIKLNGPNLPFDNYAVDTLVKTGTRLGYNETVKIGSYSVTLVDSGHIPGSSAIYVDVGGHRVLYTGDLNNIETRLVGPHRLGGLKVDTLIIESTYGDSNHPPRKLTEERFIRAVREVVEAGGTVLVPAFSVSRGQELMMLLAENECGGPVYIDGMIREVALIYHNYSEYIRRHDLLDSAVRDYVIVNGWRDRRKASRKPGVIIASAGMLKGGPSLYYFKRMADNEANGVFLVSYQAPGTPGREILETGRYAEEDIEVKARLEWFDFSSHIDQNGIVETVKALEGLKRVVLVHGEYRVQRVLAERLVEEAGVEEIVIPENGESLTFG